MSLRNGSLLLIIEALFDTSKGHVVIPPPIFLLLHPTSFESIHYNLVDSFNSSISLRIGRSKIPVLYPQIKTVLPKGFAIKLKAIIRDEGIGNPESSYDILPDESFDIYVSDISQRFNLDPFGKIICANQ